MSRKTLHKLCIFLLSGIMAFCNDSSVFAEEISTNEVSENQISEIESNQLINWPFGPDITAESAVLIDADTGVILYNKNMDTRQFPASTTKIMTCLLAIENCSLNEMVTFSKEAVFGIERGSSNAGMDVGQSITMEEALYCIMLNSANEVASAVAEHVGGSVEKFADMMNQRAKELGCTDTHFTNANGLHNDDHYTTAHDLALMTAAYFNNETLAKIAGTVSYDIYATSTQPDEFTMYNHHKMLPGREKSYEYTLGGKTGYTNAARNTLTTCAQKNGMKLICVVMRDDAPGHYNDTKNLFEYGFNNFQKINIADYETKYTIDNANFFKTDIDIFGDSKTIWSINSEGYIILPNTAKFSETESHISYSNSTDSVLADLTYTYNGIYVGRTTIDVANPSPSVFEFGEGVPEMDPSEMETHNSSVTKDNVIFVRIKIVAFIILGILGLLVVIFLLQAFFKNYHFSKRRRRKIARRRRRYISEFDDYDF